ncbi:undecaprenyldiphospho-muramoylpentapeptide beta-N-acetylglucosaminyltransferase [Thiomicrospira microaerophila]|uniref:undecaprenyldiphospho-muramoylpentapeptide beta-N-acetylglucosaminyltransferase n=1 Tax=Thiomicrospira microaerophila TaxID=406020 RepID=UPI00200D0ABF|nr:undecaprenyldiphospho-muramoylpentapeptide beta-N-acetylglucosaminyltransferase [Thiomicrospira microaerophila]UQB42639.1 undecaprenyldiphospho-muramoylpentapeptide beta-N-acetylglucosaminyltransferase [Thiomicrospira microaerophila]
MSMKNPKPRKLKKVMVMAGGTGGHVFPGIALAHAFAKEGIATHWLGTEQGLEEQWVQQAGLTFSAIRIQGLRGNGIKGWLWAPLKVTQAWWQARKIIKQVNPDIVIGMGGFVCGPGGLAAWSMGIKLYLHEQNAVAGLTNRLLASFAQRIFCGFPPSNLKSPRLLVMGNPVRAEIEALSAIDSDELTRSDSRQLLVIGGSRGARVLNQTLPQALALIPEAQRPKVLHQTGQQDVIQTQQAYQALGVEAEVFAFISDMAAAYQKTHLVVSRAGALTVSELMAAARPAILVPFPYAVDDHQTANAAFMAQVGAAEVIQQDVLTPEMLAKAIMEGLHRDRLIQASETLEKIAKLDAANQIVAHIMEWN